MEETDYRVGQVLDALKANGLDHNTLVFFSSDNGAETNYVYQRDTYQHYSSLNFKGGKRDIYEGGHRVPFLMRWPDIIKPGSIVDVPVCQSDYMATIAEIIGETLPDNAAEDSYSLYSLMKTANDETLNSRAIIHHSFTGHFAIREGKWKLNMLRGSGGSLKPVIVEPAEGEALFELYNMEEDPGETNNLYFEHPEIVERLTKKISKIIETGRSTPGAPQEYVHEKWPQITWKNEDN